MPFAAKLNVYNHVMPTLTWIGKAAVVGHHKQVPLHLLVEEPARGAGDNLLALKALLGAIQVGASVHLPGRGHEDGRATHLAATPSRKVVAPQENCTLFC